MLKQIAVAVSTIILSGCVVDTLKPELSPSARALAIEETATKIAEAQCQYEASKRAYGLQLASATHGSEANERKLFRECMTEKWRTPQH